MVRKCILGGTVLNSSLKESINWNTPPVVKHKQRQQDSNTTATQHTDKHGKLYMRHRLDQTVKFTVHVLGTNATISTPSHIQGEVKTRGLGMRLYTCQLNGQSMNKHASNCE